MMSNLPLRLRTRPAFCRSLWEKVEATQWKPKLVLPSEATIRARFCWRSMGPRETFQSSRMQPAESVHSTG